MKGGFYTYRAIAECTACEKVVDIGPFEDIYSAASSVLPGWLFASGPWMIRDQMGTPITICEDCMGRPMRDVLAQVESRAAAAAGASSPD